jgi:hypothetical protein
MRRLTAVLLILFATSLFAADDKGPKASKASKQMKAAKIKDKRFEPVAVNAASVAGSYRGPAESYGLILEVASDGTLRGNYVEMGSVAVLNAIELRGSEFTARASFDDGSSRTISGTFANRIFNGVTAFGIRLRAVPVESLGMIDTFFEKF